MNRLISVILFVFLLSQTVVYGQIVNSVGLKAGISFANQSHIFTPIDYTMETKPIAGPSFAVFAEPLSGEKWSLQVDLAFITKGSKTSTESITVNHLDNNRIIVNKGDTKVSKFYYLSISPMARYRFGQGRLTPYALIGPRLDMLMDYKTDSDYPLDEQNKIILGLSGGIGAEFNLDVIGVFLEIQYQSDIMPVTGQDPLLINNNIFLLTLGARYQIAR